MARSSSCQIPSSNRSCKRLSKFGRTVKFWCGGDHLAKKHHCPRKKPKLGRKEKFGEKGKNWKKRKFLEELDKIGRMGKDEKN